MISEIDNIAFEYTKSSYHLHKTTNSVPQNLTPMDEVAFCLIVTDSKCLGMLRFTDIAKAVNQMREDASRWLDIKEPHETIQHICALGVGTDEDDTTHMLVLEQY